MKRRRLGDSQPAPFYDHPAVPNCPKSGQFAKISSNPAVTLSARLRANDRRSCHTGLSRDILSGHLSIK